MQNLRVTIFQVDQKVNSFLKNNFITNLITFFPFIRKKNNLS
jgi:hypothetical protein